MSATSSIEEHTPTRPPGMSSPAEVTLNGGNPHVEETEKERLERLGRTRPEKFSSGWMESGFVASVALSILISDYSISGFAILVPTLERGLNIPPNGITWPANAFALVIACFLFPFGRLADMYGGRRLYIAGVAWFAIWSLIAGFSQNEIMIDICRAIQGLGPAAYLPSGVMLIGSNYRPGPRKNIVFAIYGSQAPLGFYLGIFFAGLAGQFTTWRWYFWVCAIITLITLVLAWLCIPDDHVERKNLGVKMDWWGTACIVIGLILVIFSFNQESHTPKGFGTPYIIVTLVLGVAFLAAAVYVEGWVAEQPLLPPDLFKVKYLTPLCIALTFCWGSLAVYLLYVPNYMTEYMNATPLKIVAWFTPMALTGCFVAILGGMVLHRVPGHLSVLFAGTTLILAPLLFAIIPLGANFWAWTFPSMLCGSLAVNITFTITNIFIANSLPLRFQGLAGALINSQVSLGISIFLGLADVVIAQVQHMGRLKTYRVTFWFEVACAAVTLFLLFFFVKIKDAKAGLTADEEAERKKAGIELQDGTH